jgi:hypothetical protein
VPEVAGALDGVEHLASAGESAFEEVDAVEDPLGHVLVDEAVVDMASFAAFLYDAVGAKDGEILADGGVTYAEDALDGIDVEFSIAQFDDDADSVRVRDGTEELGELPGDDGSGGNGGLSCSGSV